MNKLLTIHLLAWACIFACKPAINSTYAAVDQDSLHKRVEVSVSEATRLMEEQAQNLVILDVRTPNETVEGMIPGAIEIDFRAENFEQKVEELDTSKTYLVYCKSGKRARKVCDIMIHKGFSKIYHLEGGYVKWLESNN